MPAKPRLSAKAAQEERKSRDVFVGTFVLNAVAAVLNLSGKRSAGAVLLLLLASGLVVWWRLNSREFIARQSGVRRLAAYAVQGTPIAILVWSAWVFFRPETRDELVERLSNLARAKNWAALAQELPAIEDDSPFRDVGFHFRGMVAIESMPGPSPELFLSQVPSSSNLFALTQRLRLVALTKLPPDESPAAAAKVANEMKEVQLLNTTYYRLRLMEPSLSYAEVAKLSSEFAAKHGSFFDFTSMRNRNCASEVGRPVSIDLHDVMSIPACAALFYVREVELAHRECLATGKAEALARYDKLVERNRPHLPLWLRWLCIHPDITKIAERLRNEALPASCKESNR